MKLLFISNLYPPNVIGGYERLCYEVARAFEGRGHTIAVLTSTYGSSTASYSGQVVHRSLQLLVNATDIYAPPLIDAGAREAANAHNVSELRRVLAVEEPDVIFAWNLFFLDRSFLVSLDEVTRCVVFMLTDNWLAAALNGEFIGQFFRERVFGSPVPKAGRSVWQLGRPRWLSALRAGGSQPTARFSLRHSAIFGARFVRSLYSEAGISFASSKIIYNGVRIHDAIPDRFVDRTRFLDPSAVKLLFAGRIVDVKGAHTIIEAMPESSARRSAAFPQAYNRRRSARHALPQPTCRFDRGARNRRPRGVRRCRWGG